MDSNSEYDRHSVSKSNTARMFEARVREGRRFQGLTQAAAASRAEALEEVSDGAATNLLFHNRTNTANLRTNKRTFSQR